MWLSLMASLPCFPMWKGRFAHPNVVGSRRELTPDERVRTGGTCGRPAATLQKMCLFTMTTCSPLLFWCVFTRVNITTKPGEEQSDRKSKMH